MIRSAGFQPAEAASLVFLNPDLKLTPPGELSRLNDPAALSNGLTGLKNYRSESPANGLP